MGLLTLTEQNNNKPLSSNWCNQRKITGGKTNFEQLQEEVEVKELRKLLGNAFLYDIQQNPTTPENQKLLNGTDFTDSEGNTIEFKGIKFQLSYMNYSKYIGISANADTFTGMQYQNRTETTKADPGIIKIEQLDAREIALYDFEVMEKFLNENDTDYPLWECTNKTRVYTPKMTTFRKTYN
jgi:hypothetical protein